MGKADRAWRQTLTSISCHS